MLKRKSASPVLNVLTIQDSRLQAKLSYILSSLPVAILGRRTITV